ncbi:MAG TPA: DNA alkylation repair protein [Thermoanaerobaculia bacterium]|nr:DNA alkylation repair protein [Thermoanaerobaculia bacterium]
MTLAALRRDLRAVADPAQAEVSQRYFKEPERFLGIRVPDLRKVVRQHVDLPLRAVESLLASRWHEERLAALLILVHRYGHEPDAVYELYLRKTAHIDNWDLVDCSAPHIVGAHLFTRDRAPLYELARSASVWERRIAILATQHFIRNGEYADTLRIARLLLDDRHDLIHKAAGWMLREVANRDRTLAEQFLNEHAARMPRTMLRYAIEKFPETLRERYLATPFR